MPWPNYDVASGRQRGPWLFPDVTAPGVGTASQNGNKDIGAVPDGITPSAQAFQNTVTANEASGGGPIRIPPGAYNIEKAITGIVNSVFHVFGATFVGAGASSIAPQVNFTAGGALVVSSLTVPAPGGPNGAFLPGAPTIPTPSGISTGKVWDWGGEVFNIRASGALGDSTTDDAAAIQIAFTAAIAAKGATLIPYPNSGAYWKVASTLNIVPPAPGSCQMDLICPGSGPDNQLVWAGADNNPVIQAFGWKFSRIQGLKIRIPSPSAGVVALDLDVDANRLSTGVLGFDDLRVNFQTGTTNGVGVRFGHTGGPVGGSELSFIIFNRGIFNGNNTTGSVAFLDEHSNCLDVYWYGTGFTQYAKGYTNNGTRIGGADKWFYGCGGTGNAQDFEFNQPGSYGIYGGRYESGKRFLSTVFSSGAYTVDVNGVHIPSYAPSDNIVFYFGCGGSYTISGVEASGQAQTSAFITCQNLGSLTIGNVFLTACQIQGVDPPFTINGPIWNFYITGTGLLTGANSPSTNFTDRMGPLTGTTAPTYGTTPTADIRLGKRQKLTVTDGVGFTLTAPATKYDGAEMVWEIFNNSGGAIGVIAVDANHLLAGGTAFVGPGNGKRRVIAFGYDSTVAKWLELYRTTADT